MGEVRSVPISDRRQLAGLLDEASASDAMASYYALHHSSERVRLFAYHGSDSDPRGFLAIAQTGLDLFRPLIVPFVAKRDMLIRLLRDALRPEHPVLVALPADQSRWLDGFFNLEHKNEMELLRMEADAYEPVLNVLVVENEAPDGSPRYEIRTSSGRKSAAGVNWISGKFADVYVEAAEHRRDRVLTKSVLSALCGRLLGERLVALYRVETANLGEKTAAFNVGFRPTGRKEVLLAGSLVAEAQSADRA